MPENIAVVTSPTGAVIRDILTVLKRRFPAISITIIPALVQGEYAVKSIVQAIDIADETEADIVVIARGGGSLEDLQPFNEEEVARAIINCSKPIVSAVGHETDVTIADFVADCRAPTPSVAAELISPDKNEWMTIFQGLSTRLSQLILNKLQSAEQTIDYLRQRLRHPREQFTQLRQCYQQFDQRLQECVALSLERKEQLLVNNLSRLSANNPSQKISLLFEKMSALHFRLLQAFESAILAFRQRFEAQLLALNNLSPLRTLERGYCVALKPSDERIVRSKLELDKGDNVRLTLIDGVVDCKVL